MYCRVFLTLVLHIVVPLFGQFFLSQQNLLTAEAIMVWQGLEYKFNHTITFIIINS